MLSHKDFVGFMFPKVNFKSISVLFFGPLLFDLKKCLHPNALDYNTIYIYRYR